MQTIVQIICQRDGLTLEEARGLVEECRDALHDSEMCYDSAQEIIQEYLGLEPDYFFEILGYCNES